MTLVSCLRQQTRRHHSHRCLFSSVAPVLREGRPAKHRRKFAPAPQRVVAPVERSPNPLFALLWPEGPGKFSFRGKGFAPTPSHVVEKLDYNNADVKAGVAHLAHIMGLPQRELKTHAIGWSNASRRDDLLASLGDEQHLKQGYQLEGEAALTRAAWQSFILYVAERTQEEETKQQVERLLKLLDLRRPSAVFTGARVLPRRITMHVGPTNSGKTHAALVALSQANRGVYAGPLRLLAMEVANRFNAGRAPGQDGVPRACNMFTGEEMRVASENTGLLCCTTEMVNTTALYDVAVIDEIQLVSDPQRGSAWTRALLGVRAKEVHLCGEAAAVPLVRKMLERLGEPIEVIEYKRLTRLEVLPSPVSASKGDWSGLRSGDCLICFNRNQLFEIKDSIEKETDLKVALCYGGLPPEAREEQARRFNDGDLDVLVATDAIGLGLNLKIQRILFTTVRKGAGPGEGFRPLELRHIRQIAGRAGRYGQKRDSTPSMPDVEADEEHDSAAAGYVGVLRQADLTLVNAAMQQAPEDLHVASLEVEPETLYRLRRQLSEDATWTDVWALALLFTRTKPPYRVSISHRALEMVEMVSTVDGLTWGEQEFFCSAPLPMRSAICRDALVPWIKAKTTTEPVSITAHMASSPKHKFTALPDEAPLAHLKRLEELHRLLCFYRWLSYREPLAYPFLEDAMRLSRECEEAINKLLSASNSHTDDVEEVEQSTLEEKAKVSTDEPDAISGEKPAMEAGETAKREKASAKAGPRSAKPPKATPLKKRRASESKVARPLKTPARKRQAAENKPAPCAKKAAPEVRSSTKAAPDPVKPIEAPPKKRSAPTSKPLPRAKKAVQEGEKGSKAASKPAKPVKVPPKKRQTLKSKPPPRAKKEETP